VSSDLRQVLSLRFEPPAEKAGDHVTEVLLAESDLVSGADWDRTGDPLLAKLFSSSINTRNL
jgi:hypothetical protein